MGRARAKKDVLYVVAVFAISLHVAKRCFSCILRHILPMQIKKDNYKK